MGDRLLALEEVAERLQLKVKTVERLVERGDLPAEMVDGHWMVQEEDARQFALNFNH